MSYILLGDNAKGIGGKAAGFYKLKTAGIAFPAGIIIRQHEIVDILNGNTSELQKCISKMDNLLSIRSSANVEDGEIQSYAGMFTSCLNVENKLESVVAAIQKTYCSKNSSFLQRYSMQSKKEICMSIILQKMVQDIKFNGVIFGDTTDEKGEHPVLLEFCKEGNHKIVDGHDLGNQILLYDNGTSFCSSNMIYKGKEKDIIWLNDVCKIMDKIKECFDNIKFDIEWCVDNNNNIHILQLRPTTAGVLVQSGIEEGNVIIGSYGIVKGNAVVFDDDLYDTHQKDISFNSGDIFVGEYMDTRYYEYLEKAGGIIVGSSSVLAHAALVARENNVPCMIVGKDVISKIQNNDELSIDTYSKTITVNGDKVQFCDLQIDWARMYDFDSLLTLDYLNHEVLLEKTLGGVVAHIPDEATNEFSNSLKKEYRELMGCDIEIRKSSKYLWYYEYCRYKKIQLFNKLVEIIMKAIDDRNLDIISQMYEKSYDIVKSLNQQKNNENDIERQIYLDEVIRSIFFMMDMFIPLGRGHKHICLRVMPWLMREKLSFSEFISCEEKSINDVELLKERKVINLLEALRDQVTTRFCELEAFDYDYYDKRTDLVCNKLKHCDEESFLQELMEKMETINNEIFVKYISFLAK